MKKLRLTKIILIVLLLCGCSPKQPISKTQLLLDTQVTITLYDHASNNILEDCFEICKKYELYFSRTNPQSELYQLNHQDKSKPIEISDELAKVIQIGLDYSKLSNGSFDITIGTLIDLWDFKSANPKVPNSNDINQAINSIGYQNIILEDNLISFNNPNTIIDLGAIAKGYIGDKIKEYLISEGVNSAIINLGGNVVLVGDKNGQDFKVGIANPQGGEDIVRLNIADKSIVTSGTYQRCFKLEDQLYHHILNPKTGYPYNNNLTSVTIISDQSVDGDVLSTVCFTLGKEKGLELINQTKGVEAIFIDASNQIYYSNNVKKYIKE